MNTSSPTPDVQMLHRVCCEFLEMPGLQLTRRQAQRLWGLEEGVCVQLLEWLVEARFLCRRARDSYARLTDGPVALPRPRRAKAQMEDTTQQDLKQIV
jgi:hypothetical protein